MNEELLSFLNTYKKDVKNLMDESHSSYTIGYADGMDIIITGVEVILEKYGVIKSETDAEAL